MPVPPTLTPWQWLTEKVGIAAARALTLWASGILAAWGLAFLTLSFNMIVGGPDGAIKSSEIVAEALALGKLLLWIVVPGIVLWLAAHLQKTVDGTGRLRLPPGASSTFSEEDKAKLKGLVTTVTVGMASIAISYVFHESAAAILDDWQSAIGEVSHYIPLVIAMALFTAAAFISPGIWYYLFDAIKRAIAAP